MDELRVDVGGKKNRKKKLGRNWLKWDSYVERMGDEKWQRNELPRKCKQMEAKKTENAMGGLRLGRYGKCGRIMEYNSKKGV